MPHYNYCCSCYYYYYYYNNYYYYYFCKVCNCGNGSRYSFVRYCCNFLSSRVIL